MKLRAVRFDERKHKAWGGQWLDALKEAHCIERMGTLTTTMSGFRWTVEG